VFEDLTTLIWSTTKQSFVHLNPLASWVHSCLKEGDSESLIVQLLEEERTLNGQNAKAFVQSLSDPNSVFRTSQQNPPHSDEGSFIFPFIECADADIEQGTPWKLFPVTIGGTKVCVNIYSESIDLARVTRSFAHLVNTDEYTNSIFSIDVGATAAGRLWAACDATGGFYAVDNDELTTLIYWMLYKTVESSRDWLVALHAGGVQAGDKAIILSGKGGSGKSTLTVALTHKFKTYLSDELIVISRHNHLVWSVPTAPCLKEGSWRATTEVYPMLDRVEPMKRLDRYVKFLPVTNNISMPANTKTDNAILIFPTFQKNCPATINSLSIGEAIDSLIVSGGLFGEFRNKADFCDFAKWLGRLDCYKIQYSSTKQGLKLVEYALSRTKPGGDRDSIRLA